MNTQVNTSTMNAIQMRGFGSSDLFAIKELPKPSPQEGEVQIRIKAAAFNPVDYKIRQGWYKGDSERILGFDCSGIIDAVGTGVSNFKVGDEVYAMTIKSSNGSYAEFVSLPAIFVAKKPASLSFEQAAATPLAAMTAYRATIAASAFKKTDVVFVAGIGGGVGSFAIQFLRKIGVKEIFTIAKDQESAEYLHEELGIHIDHILIYDKLSLEELKNQLLEKNGGRFFDATLDLIGGERKQLCLELTGYSGHFSTILPEAEFDHPFWQENALPRARNLSVHQINIGAELADSSQKSWEIYRRHLKEVTKMFDEKELMPPKTTVVGGLNVKTVQQAHQLLESGRVKGKLVMVVE